MADDPKYPNPAAEGVVAKAQRERGSKLDAAESAALNPTPPPAAAPAPTTPTTPSPPSSPTLFQRVKNMVGLKDGGKVGYACGGGVKKAMGGPIQGPGTSRSDSIPARLSKGEYVLPADTVKKVGAKNLDHLRKSTHNPGNRVPGRAKHKPGSRGM